jgi:hypothetical protein
LIWPFARELVVISSGTRIDKSFSAVRGAGVVLSVTRTLKLNIPLMDGVPLMPPVDAVNVNPPGNAPVTMVQVYGATPPVDVNCAVYAKPTLPSGSDVVVMVSA